MEENGTQGSLTKTANFLGCHFIDYILSWTQRKSNKIWNQQYITYSIIVVITGIESVLGLLDGRQ